MIGQFKIDLSAINLGLITDSEKKLIECFYGRSTVNTKRQPVTLEKSIYYKEPRIGQKYSMGK